MTGAASAANPFPGLRPFRQDEDYLFFGREEQTMELLERLASHRFVAVVGTSGSGKSSLVRCGLLSELQGGKMLRAGTAWEVAVTHPGGNPLALLAEALLEADLYDPDQPDAREHVLATLSRSHFGLIEAVKQARLPEGTNFLLVVDQFEEIFRFSDAGQVQQEAANEFISILLEAVAQSEVPVYVVLTMRSDFIGDCGGFEGLAEMVNRGEFLIPRLTREQYKRVIESPIKVAGGTITPRLLQRLLNDLGEQADQLPCLQHALMRTWTVWSESGRSGPLDLEHYQRVGKMSQALSLHADEVYDSLADDRQRELCAGVFRALTVQESEHRGIRRPQRLGTLCQILEVPQADLEPIIDAYREHGVTFLMPPSEVKLDERTIIDISHESLMRVWKRLGDWVEAEAQSARIYRRLADTAALHADGKAGVYHDPDLEIALTWKSTSNPTAAWARRYHDGFETAMAFLETSRAAKHAAEQEKEAARRRELEQAKKLAEAERLRASTQQRAARRLRGLVAGLGVVAAVALVATVFALRAHRAAKRNADAANLQRQIAEQLGVRAQQQAQLAMHNESRANTNAQRAQEQADLAEQARQLSRRTLYASQINMAQRALETPGSMGRFFDLLDATDQTDLRGWEWYYLNAQRASPSRAIAAGKFLTCVAWSPDGKRLASSGQRRNTITIWDAQSLEEVFTLPGHAGSVWTLEWSSDGTRLASGGDDWTVRVWDLQSMLQTESFRHSAPVAWAGWAPGGPGRLASASRDGNVVIWDTDTGRQLHSFAATSGFFQPCSWSPDGAMLAAGTASAVVVWDTQAGAAMQSFRRHQAWVHAIAWSPEGARIATVDRDGVIRTWDPQTGEEVERPIETHVNSQALAWSHDGQWLITGGQDASLTLWDPAQGRKAVSLNGHRRAVTSVSWQPGGRRLASASIDGTVRVWNRSADEQTPALSGHAGPVHSVAFSPDGRRLASAGQDRTIRIWDAASRQLLQTLTGHSNTVNVVSWSPDGRFLASAGDDTNVKIWDPQTGREVTELPGRGTAVVALAWSGDSRRLALGFRANESPVYVWHFPPLGKPTLLLALAGHTAAVRCLAWSPDETRLASAGSENSQTAVRIRIWDVNTGKLHSGIEAPPQEFHALSFSPKSNLLAAAGDTDLGYGTREAQVTLWNPETGDQIRALQGHTGRVRGLSWNADGTRLVTAGEDRTARIWHAQTGQELLALPQQAAALNAVAWDPTGLRIAAAGAQGSVHVWDAMRGFEQSLSPRLVELLDRKIADGTANANDYRLRAQARARAGRWDLAKADYEQAAKQRGPNAPKWFVSPWWLVGPYPDDLEAAFPPETDPDPHRPVRPSTASGETGNAPTLNWRPVALAENNGLDLAPLFEPHEFISCYLYARVYSLRQQQVAILFGTDDQHRLWINGEHVHANTRGRPAVPDQDAVRVTLNAGWNTVLLKVVNGILGYEVFFRLSDDPIQLARALTNQARRPFALQSGWEQVIEQWDRVIELYPQHAGLLHARARAAGSAQRWDLARADLTSLLDRFPNNVALLRERADVCQQQQDWQAAYADLANAVALRPADWSLRLDLGRFAARMSEQNAAVAATQSATDSPSTDDNPIALLGRGLAFQEIGKTEQADADFARALELIESEPPDQRREIAQTLRGAATRYVDQNDLDTAVLTLTMLIALQPDDAGLLSQRGNLYGRRGRWQHAADDLLRAVELGSNNPLDWLNVSPLLVKTGQNERYLQHVAQMDERFGSRGSQINGLTMQGYALLSGQDGDWDGLAERAAAYAEQAPNAFARAVGDATRGVFYYRAGRYDDAIQWLTKGTASLGNNDFRVRFLYFLAMAHQDAGQAEQARQRLLEANSILLHRFTDLHQRDLSPGWAYWLTAWVVRREAEESIFGPVGAVIAEADDLGSIGKHAQAVEALSEAITLQEARAEDADSVKLLADLIAKRAQTLDRLQRTEDAAADWRRISQLSTIGVLQATSARAVPLQNITIDGNLDDWPEGITRHPIRNNTRAYGPNDVDDTDLATSTDLSPSFQVGYSAQSQELYVAVIVRDDRLQIGPGVTGSDAVELYVDGTNSKRSRPVRWDNLDASSVPALQLVAVPGNRPAYGGSLGQNPAMTGGDITKTTTRMAFSRTGDVTVYEWAVQVFDRYPDRPTRLVPGKRIGFDVVAVDKDSEVAAPAWVCWGPPAGAKMFNAHRLGELILVADHEQ